ncbi:MAG: hypothetical protein ABFD98_11715 [Syntrophobacteraceae bacterium]|nr:hypothetical protein [Desulfobacteraceae bacterium]
MEKRYCIGGRAFVQRPIVLGQLRLLLAALDGMTFDSASPLGVLRSLGEKLPAVLSILLVEEDLGVREAMERQEERAERIGWEASPEVCLEAVEDFFACNPVSSVSERLGKILEQVAGETPEASKPPFSSSAEETSARETGFSGERKPGWPSSGSGCTSAKEETQPTGD